MQSDQQCDIHGEMLRYVCLSCKKIVCQECTLWDHKDHNTVTVDYYAKGAPAKLKLAMAAGERGKQLIKNRIDQAVNYSQAIERHAVETSQKIRKSMRAFMLIVEEREKSLLDKVEKIRLQKSGILADQMTGLRSALAGLATTSDMMGKAADLSMQTVANNGLPAQITNMELARTLTRGEQQMQQFSLMYTHLQPKEECIAFTPPNYDLMHEIRQQGDVKLVSRDAGFNNSGGSPIGNGNILTRRPIVRSTAAVASNGINASSLPTFSAWDPLIQTLQQQQHQHLQQQQQQLQLQQHRIGSPPSGGGGGGLLSPHVGQSIPGSSCHVVIKPSMSSSTSFAFDGHDDGQVSRPWGLCVDRDGNIIVADRRNNRVQVFYPTGQFKLKFGSKGAGNGQFDLPAGISTDPQNRIVVVDKDNHRIQIFTAAGTFLLKFGSYGKDCGQFQYPWDVAVNSKGDMLVTDSRNHRIQMFNQEGHFISRFSFDGMNHSRALKGLTTPRGVCYTPQGDIIVSDFENHRLLLIDAALTKVCSFRRLSH